MDLFFSKGGFRTEIDVTGSQTFTAYPLFFNQFEQRIVSSHRQQRGELLVSHSPFALVDKELHGILQTPLLGEASRLPDPETSGIKLSDLIDRQKLPRIIVA